jgi:molybdopterin-guanine dinucleotide biosynthesis protein A
MPTWSAAILAGGRARRLGGRVKPLLDVGGQSIVARQRALFASFDVVPRLIAPDPAPLIGLGLDIVADRDDAGALGALWTALDTAATDVIVVVAGDMPFVTADLVRMLLHAVAGHDAAVPRTADGWHPLAAAYRRSVSSRLRAALDSGERRVVAAVTALDCAVLDDGRLAALDPDGTLFCNVNTPDDYERAQRLAAARRALDQ